MYLLSVPSIYFSNKQTGAAGRVLPWHAAHINALELLRMLRCKITRVTTRADRTIYSKHLATHASLYCRLSFNADALRRLNIDSYCRDMPRYRHCLERHALGHAPT